MSLNPWSSFRVLHRVSVLVLPLLIVLAAPGAALAACGPVSGFYGFLLQGVTSNCLDSGDNGGFELELTGNLRQQGCTLTLGLEDTSEGLTEVTLSGAVSGSASAASWSGSISVSVTYVEGSETGTGAFSGSVGSGELDVTYQTQITSGDTCRTNGRLRGQRFGDVSTTTTFPLVSTTLVPTSTTLPGPCSGVIDGTLCDDGIFCNGTDSCIAGDCLGHSGDPCLNSTVCTTACSEATDNCPATAGDSCTDGDLCNGDEVCGDQADCMAGVPLDCSDGDVCTADICEVGVGCRNDEVVGACPLCGDPTFDGNVFASDALFVLGAAVGKGACQRAICDADDSGAIRASDALAVLQVAVGLIPELGCPEPGLVLSGTVAHGAAAAQGTKVCVKTYEADGEFLLEEEIDCTLTDASGGWFINLPELLDGAATVKTFLDDPEEGLDDLFSGWFSDDDSKDNEIVNVNPITDLAMRSMGDNATDGNSESPDDCDDDCATALANQARNGGFEDALAGAESLYGELAPPGSADDWLSAPYDPNPLTNPRDAMLERARPRFETPGDRREAVLENVLGEEIARASFGDIADDDVDPNDAVDAGAAVRAERARGGFGSGVTPDGTRKFACWKEFRSGSGILARVEDSCVADPADCTAMGGEAGESPHPDEATCIARCQANALGPPELAAAEEPFCPTAEFFDKRCVDTFTAGTTADTLDFQEACDAGSSRGCACRDEGEVQCGFPFVPGCCITISQSFDSVCGGSPLISRTCYFDYPEPDPKLKRLCSCETGKVVESRSYQLFFGDSRHHGPHRGWRCDGSPVSETRWFEGEVTRRTSCGATDYIVRDENDTIIAEGSGCPLDAAPECPEEMFSFFCQ
jgi:hypothetical protein